MDNMTEKEKLALLGFDDPQHSIAWYKQNLQNLPEILEKYIVDTLNQYGIFPRDASRVEAKIRYHRFYLVIESNNNKYLVKINNTDRREVLEEYPFEDVKEAAKFLINKSYTMGGSIKQYWDGKT